MLLRLLTSRILLQLKRVSSTNGAGGALLSTPWAVYVNGNYAYVVGNSNALEIVNVSNPAAPVHAGSLANGAGGALLDSPTGVFVTGKYAYVTSQNSNALEVVDVSNPAVPVPCRSLQMELEEPFCRTPGVSMFQDTMHISQVCIAMLLKLWTFPVPIVTAITPNTSFNSTTVSITKPRR